MTEESEITTGPSCATKIRLQCSCETQIEQFDVECKRASVHAVFCWIILVISSYTFSDKEVLVQLTGTERNAPLVALSLIGASCVSSLLPFICSKEKNRLSGGVMIAALVVQSIAMLTDIMLSCVAVPVMLNPITGTKVYLLRWAEWTPLAYLMTFLTEGSRIYGNNAQNLEDHNIDSSGQSLYNMVHDLGSNESQLSTKSIKSNSKEEKSHITTHEFAASMQIGYISALCQGSSTFCGFLFPWCTNAYYFYILLFISSILYACIILRYIHRKSEFRGMSAGTTIQDKEIYNWTKLSLELLWVCVIVWTILVVAYFFYTFGPLLFKDVKVFQNSSLTMICECSFDVLAKFLYLAVILEVYSQVFDRGARSERRLEELRQLMNVVWDNSSDIIVLSVKNGIGNTIKTMLSPSYLNLYRELNNNKICEKSKLGFTNHPLSCQALVFDLDTKDFDVNKKEQHLNTSSPETTNEPKITPQAVYVIDFNDSSKRKRGQSFTEKETILKDLGIASSKDLCSMADLVVTAWGSKENEKLVMHDLVCEKNSSPVRCEAKIRKLDSNTLLIVIRDISDSLKVIAETTARQKDADANRFTRHEVKNGLLAAIELSHDLHETLAKGQQIANQYSMDCNLGVLSMNKENYLSDDMSSLIDMTFEANRRTLELDKTLHEILDTILAEAMARDVIHEAYEQKMGRVDVNSLLSDGIANPLSRTNSSRFPILSKPAKFPAFASDPQLLKYIHRNAVSNACKYGKPGGLVLTELFWDNASSTFTMNVTNLPGKNHDLILEMGDLAQDIVFTPRKQLKVHMNKEGNKNLSSGDGAWIMRKCAKTLGGTCDIKFEKNQSVFSFKCPMVIHDKTIKESTMSMEATNFKLPKNIYAFGVDDSKIQCKLLKRFFIYANINENRIHIFGNSSSELKDFDSKIVKFIQNHSDDYFLCLVDENLDIHEEDNLKSNLTISGSLCVSNILKQLQSDQERRVLALIRSANDSAHDVAIYNSRAHGYLPKSPVKKDQVLEILSPLWLKRFPKSSFNQSERRTDECKGKNIDDIAENRVVENDNNVYSFSLRDVSGRVDRIDQLVLSDINSLTGNWPLIWENLQCLKGDLLTLPSSEKVSTAIDMISSLRDTKLPESLLTRWNAIRSIILQNID